MYLRKDFKSSSKQVTEIVDNFSKKCKKLLSSGNVCRERLRKKHQHRQRVVNLLQAKKRSSNYWRSEEICNLSGYMVKL